MTNLTQMPNIEDLRASMRGSVLVPNDPGYEESRAVYNGMIDRRPAVIARCVDTADVISAVRFGREHDLTVAVRGGGHNAGGLGVWDDAIVVDLSAMRGVRVDPVAKTARVAGGCVWGDVDHATSAFGLAVTSGIIATTGVGGLTLGGGIGYLARQCGLTIDNLLSADVVLADGSFVTASSESHPDLFWALRGGGGNFGVVTSFLFRCHDIGTVVAGPIFYELDDTARVLRWYRELQPALPEQVNGFFALLTVPPAEPFPEHLWGRPVCGIFWCYSGDVELAEDVLEPVRSFGSPVFDGLAAMPYHVWQSAFDALYPAGLQWYWRADFIRDITDEAVVIHERFGHALPSPLSTMHLYPIDGAVHRVPPGETPFAYRDVGWAAVIVGVDPDPAQSAALTSWTVDYWDALHAHSAGGAYVNFMMNEGSDRVRAAYGPNYDRLAVIKARYDPENVFRVNQNIPPAG